ncbi:S1C family serine protease [Deinococcus sp.]|uniref:S1C family serine protease n=1 Tax=Deinococcus sp. TaxID=47478 RepID=UPI003C7A4A52
MSESNPNSPVEHALQSVVTVSSARGPVISGTVIGPELVLTTAHVLRGGALRVTLAGHTLEAALVGRDPLTDLAALRVPGLSAAPIAPGTAPRLGDAVFAAARPEHGPMVTSGVFSAQVRERGRHWLLTDARPFPGFSGGALISETGGLLGLLNAGVSRGELLSVPAEVALGVTEQLAARGKVARGRLGVSTQPVRLADGAVALLTVGIEPGSAAATAGLLVGDVLRSWNEAPLQSGDELLVQVLGAAGQTVTLGVTRGAARLELSVTVGEADA